MRTKILPECINEAELFTIDNRSSDVTEVKKENQGPTVALQLTTFDEINQRKIPERVINEIDRTQLELNNGLQVLVDFLDTIYKEGDLPLLYEKWIGFDLSNVMKQVLKSLFGISKVIQWCE